jgi:hypothetical protein
MMMKINNGPLTNNNWQITMGDAHRYGIKPLQGYASLILWFPGPERALYHSAGHRPALFKQNNLRK